MMIAFKAHRQNKLPPQQSHPIQGSGISCGVAPSSPKSSECKVSCKEVRALCSADTLTRLLGFGQCCTAKSLSNSVALATCCKRISKRRRAHRTKIQFVLSVNWVPMFRFVAKGKYRPQELHVAAGWPSRGGCRNRETSRSVHEES